MRPEVSQIVIIVLALFAAFGAGRTLFVDTRGVGQTVSQEKSAFNRKDTTEIPRPAVTRPGELILDHHSPEHKKYSVPLETGDSVATDYQEQLKKYIRTEVCADPQFVASICYDFASITEADWAGREQRLENIIRMSEYQNLVHRLAMRQTSELWAKWKRVLLQERGASATHQKAEYERALSVALQDKLSAKQEQTPDVYKQAQDLLKPGMLPAGKQTEVITLLSGVKTREAMETMLSLLAYPEHLDESKDLKYRLAEAVVNPTYLGFENQPLHTDYSILLEKAWSQTNDPMLQASIAVGMANIGTPENVRWFADVLNEADRIDDVQQKETLRGMLIPAMEKIQNPKAIPMLLDNMQKYSPDARIVEGSGYALAHFINQPKAAWALTEWGVNAPAAASGMVGNWFQIIVTHSPELLRSLQDDIKKRRFRSEQVRRVILSINVPSPEG